MSCYTESQIAAEACRVIAARPGIRTSQLIAALRASMCPSGEDLEILSDRNDDRFSQKVRNLKSHDTLAEKVYTVGDRDRQWFPKT